MGADLIGYQAMYPKQFNTNEKKQLNSFLDELESFLATKDLASKIVTEIELDKTTPILTKLQDLTYYIPYEINDRGIYDNAEDIAELIDEVSGNIKTARDFIDSPIIDGRDTSFREYKFGDRTFLSVFAGEMSWGDTPSGYGYETLQHLDQVGILSKAEEFNPFNKPNTLNFIKE